MGLDRKPHLGIERRPFAVPWTNGSGGEAGTYERCSDARKPPDWR